MFHGLNAFPLTPFTTDGIDERAYEALIQRLATAGVDEITALGSTGSYAYLTREERRRVVTLAAQNAGDVPLVAGVGALRTTQVLDHVDDAQAAGAAGVLLAPVSYQALTPDEVYGLFEEVSRELSVPLVIYDNPGTTHFTFTHELYAAIASLPNVSSVKIPGVPDEPAAASERVNRLRRILPYRMSIGVSGDAMAATGLNAGCDVWYSVIAGTFPEPAVGLTRAATAGDAARARQISSTLQPIWQLFARYGSLRVIAAIGEALGLVPRNCVPLPIRGLDTGARQEVADVCQALGLGDESQQW